MPAGCVPVAGDNTSVERQCSRRQPRREPEPTGPHHLPHQGTHPADIWRVQEVCERHHATHSRGVWRDECRTPTEAARGRLQHPGQHSWQARRLHQQEKGEDACVFLHECACIQDYVCVDVVSQKV